MIRNYHIANVLYIISHNHSSNRKYVLQQNCCVSRWENQITVYPDDGDVSFVFHVVTFTKTANVAVISKLPPCVARHVGGWT